MSSTSNTNNTNDPLGILTNPSSSTTFVKIQGTSRDDVNGTFGLAVRYDVGRGRYMIRRVTDNQAAEVLSAFKPEHLVKATTLETYQAQFQFLRNDPTIKRQLREYYNVAQGKLPAPVKVEHVAGGIALLFLLEVYVLGISKTLLLWSMILLLGMIVGPDLVVVRQATPRTVVANFPRRCREMIEQSSPDFVRGKIPDKVAAGVILFLVVFTIKSVFWSGGSAAGAGAGGTAAMVPPVTADSSTTTSSTRMMMMSVDQAYKLGFDDATAGKDFGTSMSSSSDATTATTTDIIYNDRYLDADYNMPPSQPTQKSSSSSVFGFTQIMAIFYLYRTITELGGNPMNAGETFSMERLVANAKTMEPWKMGILGFSVYNLVKGFLF